MVHIRSYSHSAELLVELFADSSLTLQAQLRSQLLTAVEQGRIAPGDRLPPSRQLARDLGVARGTVVEVYDQLVQEGYLAARRGSGTVVAPGLARPAGTARNREDDKAVTLLYDLRPGAPDLGSFPRSAWISASTHVVRMMGDASLGYVHPWGSEVLRGQLAPYLARTRHVTADVDDIVVTSGVTQGLTLLMRVLRARGLRAIAVEDPSNAIQRQVLSRYGLRIVDVPVGGEGLDLRALERTGVRAVLVTPAHQYPTGMAMDATRRALLLDWARRCDAVILEDDYDAEFQFQRLPMPSMQASGPDLVVHLSSVSKTLAPGVRIGWMVVPPGLRDEVRGAKRDDDFGSCALTQHTFARMLATGAYDRHLRRQRLHYRMQREALVEAVSDVLPDWTVRGEQAGLHMWLEPPAPVDEGAVVAEAARRGVVLLGMGAMCRSVTVSGLALGFARLPTHQAAGAAALLADSVRAAQRSPGADRAGGLLPPAYIAARLGTTGVDFFPAGQRIGAEPDLVADGD